MPISIVVGGQYGSEGKGKVAQWLAREMGASTAVRIGGSNSGHTGIDRHGNRVVLRQLPTAALLPDVLCVLAAGSYIEPKLLSDEMRLVGLSPERLVIDPNAFVVSDLHRMEEATAGLYDRIGSTQSGTGAAVIQRIQRQDTSALASNNRLLRDFVRPVTPLLREHLNAKERVIIEGTQGFGLSLLHSPHYPYATSRDTTAAGFLAEAGASPLDVDDVVMVIRAFPIRVPGPSGPLANETDWESVTASSGSKTPLLEHTSVTRRVRRVGYFDPSIVRQALLVNDPTRIVLNHCDYIDAHCAGLDELPPKSDFRVQELECSIGRSFDMVGTSPSTLTLRNTVFSGANSYGHG